jgi:DNA-directed RNA polymerase subunit RPC12/RpoP
MTETTTLVVLAVAVVLLAGGLAFWLLRRKGQHQATDTTVHHFRCTKCKRRLRFQARQVGHKGKCSHCGSLVIFPPVSQAVD